MSDANLSIILILYNNYQPSGGALLRDHVYYFGIKHLKYVSTRTRYL